MSELAARLWRPVCSFWWPHIFTMLRQLRTERPAVGAAPARRRSASTRKVTHIRASAAGETVLFRLAPHSMKKIFIKAYIFNVS